MMAVFWRSNENTGAPDARYRAEYGPTPLVAGAAGQKNTFLEKHLRICNPLPSEAEMKRIVKQVYDDRQKAKTAKVKSVAGPSDKTKKQLYGNIKPPANSTYFVELAGFQETNAWIEKNINASSTHAQVPILGGGVVVTYKKNNNTYDVRRAGMIK